MCCCADPVLYQRLKSYLQRKGLKLNETNTRVLDVLRESLHFLGFEVGWQQSRTTGKSYPARTVIAPATITEYSQPLPLDKWVEQTGL